MRNFYVGPKLWFFFLSASNKINHDRDALNPEGGLFFANFVATQDQRLLEVPGY